MDREVLKKSAIARITTPTIVFNGGKDTMVRPQAEGLFVTRARRASAPVRFYHFDDGHHELFSETPEITSRYFTMILSFFLAAAQEE
jgi:alpha-beta hydrolase superfamily lysophospholipase